MKKLIQILACKCPNCAEEKIFKYSSLNLPKFMIMNDRCSKCNYNFMPEPGFYLGAMYISYFINSFIFLFAALMSVFYFELEMETTLIILLFLSILALPYTLRVSRVIWLMINHKKPNE